MKTIKTKLIVLFALVLAVGLGAMALNQTLGERTRVTADISTRAVHFAELSGEGIAELFDVYYRSQSFALFDSELTRLLARDPDISRVQLVSAEGAVLFDSTKKPDAKLAPIGDMALLARLKINKLSVADADGGAAYLAHKENEAAAYRAENAAGKMIIPTWVGDAQTASIVYPLADDRRRVILYPSYAEVTARVTAAVLSLGVLFILVFLGSLALASWFAGTITSPLSILRAGAERLASGDWQTRIHIATTDETKLLADTFNHMTVQLAASVKEKIAFERTAREFELASDIQRDTLPRVATVAGLDVAFRFRPATAVGGDVYDVVPMAGGKTLFYLADVTGHGVPAGIVAALTSAVMATVAAETDDLARIIARANAILHTKTKSSMFATMIAFVWDAPARTLTSVNAGHDPALIFRVNNASIAHTAKGTTGLGMFDRLHPMSTVETITLAAGDVLFASTDGISEAHNPTHAMFGADRLNAIFKTAAHTSKTAADVCDTVIANLDTFCDGASQEDDITCLAIRARD